MPSNLTLWNSRLCSFLTKSILEMLSLPHEKFKRKTHRLLQSMCFLPHMFLIKVLQIILWNLVALCSELCASWCSKNNGGQSTAYGCYLAEIVIGNTPYLHMRLQCIALSVDAQVPQLGETIRTIEFLRTWGSIVAVVCLRCWKFHRKLISWWTNLSEGGCVVSSHCLNMVNF